MCTYSLVPITLMPAHKSEPLLLCGIVTSKSLAEPDDFKITTPTQKQKIALFVVRKPVIVLITMSITLAFAVAQVSLYFNCGDLFLNHRYLDYFYYFMFV